MNGCLDIFFLRHGETEWNREKRIQGSTAWTDLTPDGVRLAETTRDGMMAAGIAFDRIYTSPYRRARHTAEIVAAGFGLVPVDDARLREISFGPYEGTRYADGLFADDNIRACFMDPPRYVARGDAETFDAAAARVRDFIDSELAPLAQTCSRILAVAHGGILRTVLRLAMNRPLEDFWKGSQPNCCVHVVGVEQGRLSLKARSLTFPLQNAVSRTS